MEEKIENSIALHQQTIYELGDLKNKVIESQGDNVRFMIKTKHWYGFAEPFLMAIKDRIYLSKYTMLIVLDEAIKLEKERINKLIDKEIENRKEGK